MNKSRRLLSSSLRVAETSHLRLIRQPVAVRYSSVDATDKFRGKHTTLDVKIPDLEEAETSSAIDPANVPYVPDQFHSEAKSAEIEANKAKQSVADSTPKPKVVTAAAVDTLPGVSSNVFQKTEDLKAFAGEEVQKAESKIQEATSTLKSWTENLRLPGLASISGDSARDGSSDPKRTQLDGNDVQGLYVLLGIVGGGWLLGGLFSKKGVQPVKHSHSH